MRTPLCDEFGMELPIFAFSHCRDVVAAVSRAGGMGVLGALAFSPPVLIMSLIRPTTRQDPSASISARSPVCSQPSASMVSAVATGSSR